MICNAVTKMSDISAGVDSVALPVRSTEHFVTTAKKVNMIYIVI